MDHYGDLLQIGWDEMTDILVINLWEPGAECCMCGKDCPLEYCVGYYCGPTHDPIGSITTEYTDGGIVGGMSVCKFCHDEFYKVV